MTSFPELSNMELVEKLSGSAEDELVAEIYSRVEKNGKPWGEAQEVLAEMSAIKLEISEHVFEPIRQSGRMRALNYKYDTAKRRLLSLMGEKLEAPIT